MVSILTSDATHAAINSFSGDSVELLLDVVAFSLIQGVACCPFTVDVGNSVSLADEAADVPMALWVTAELLNLHNSSSNVIGDPSNMAVVAV